MLVIVLLARRCDSMAGLAMIFGARKSEIFGPPLYPHLGSGSLPSPILDFGPFWDLVPCRIFILHEIQVLSCC